MLEELEGRVLLAANFTWNYTDTGFGDYADPNLWLSQGGGVPGPNDTAIIPAGTGNMSMTGVTVGTLTVVPGWNGAFNISQGLTINNGGTIPGASFTQVDPGANDPINLAGGTLTLQGPTYISSSSSPLNVAAGATLKVDTNGGTFRERVPVNNSGTIIFAANSITEMKGGGSDPGVGITNGPAADIQLVDNAQVILDVSYLVPGVLMNSGTVEKTGNRGQTATLALPVVNTAGTATLAVHDGILSITGTGQQSGYTVVQNAGTTSLDNGTDLRTASGYLQNAGTFKTTGAAATLEGRMNLGGGIFAISAPAGTIGTLNVTGPFTMTGGTWNASVDGSKDTADNIVATGAIALSNVTLDLTTFDGVPQDGDLIPFLKAVNGPQPSITVSPQSSLTYPGGSYNFAVKDGNPNQLYLQAKAGGGGGGAHPSLATTPRQDVSPAEGRSAPSFALPPTVLDSDLAPQLVDLAILQWLNGLVAAKRGEQFLDV